MVKFQTNTIPHNLTPKA